MEGLVGFVVPFEYMNLGFTRVILFFPDNMANFWSYPSINRFYFN